MVSFENFVKSLPPSLSELKVKPIFCFPIKIRDDPTASNVEGLYSKSWIAFQSRNSKTMATVNIILRLWFILCRHDSAKSTMTNQILTIVCFLYFFCLSIFSSQFNLLPSALCHPVITSEQGLTQLLLHLKNWQFVHH